MTDSLQEQAQQVLAALVAWDAAVADDDEDVDTLDVLLAVAEKLARSVLASLT
jgi:hypothetical protein